MRGSVKVFGIYMVAVIFGALSAVGAAFGFPCKGETVIAADTPEEMAKKCGEPLGKETRADKVTEAVEGDVTRQTAVSVVESDFDVILPLSRSLKVQK